MMWKRERDLLIAQTMAFVQSVSAGKPVDSDGSLQPRLPSVSPDQPAVVARPADVLPPRLTPINQGDLRDEIHRRVAAFRARHPRANRRSRLYPMAQENRLRGVVFAALNWIALNWIVLAITPGRN
jgi:hypothetical protein